MNAGARLALMAVIAFSGALAGVFAGRSWIAPPVAPETGLHALLHRDLDLDPAQQARVAVIERGFAGQRAVLERELRADNARIAEAIGTEHGYGPGVAAAVDRSHRAMGALQKATLEHVFAMRGVLRPDQAARFDRAVAQALTADPR